MQWGAPNWRFGVFGVLASRASVLVLADVMFFAAAVGLGQWNTLRILGVLHLVLSAAVIAGLCLFVLDTAQIRGMVSAEGERAYGAAAARAGIVGAMSAALLAWAGFASLRASRAALKTGPAEEAPLVVGGRPRRGGGR
jgi:hypothetical protein